MGSRIANLLRLYAKAALVLLGGLVVSMLLAWQLRQKAEKLDEERFKLESHVTLQLLETTMERYEERLARLADHCALFEELPPEVWSFRSGRVTDFNYNLPSILQAVFCPKIKQGNFETHAERARTLKSRAYEFDPERRPNQKLALPVEFQYTRAGVVKIPLGTDMAYSTNWHPSLEPALGQPAGWVSSKPVQLPRTNGTFETGFWFVIPTYKAHQQIARPSRLRYTNPAAELNRTRSLYRSAATGLLAVFISTDRMIDKSYNLHSVSNRIHVRLYASKTPEPESLLNPASNPPDNPRHRQLKIIPWYARRWCLETASTPLFEAESPRSLAAMALLAGCSISFITSALIGLSIRGNLRQQRMTQEITEARDTIAAVERDREQLGHDLHDGAIQSLYAIQLGLSRTAEDVGTKMPTAATTLAATRERLDEVIADLRRFINEPAPTESPATPLQVDHVLSSMVQWLKPTTGATLSFSSRSEISKRVTTAQAVTLTQICRTALANALRHSKAGNIQVRLDGTPQAIQLWIEDDGVGFNPEDFPTAGIGLRTMRKRVLEMHGTLVITSQPGQGTRIAVTLPSLPTQAG
jgi:signal transduction histidine kinase